MTKLTTERLEQFIANPLGNALYRTEQMDMARQLLAYEQAAQNPIGYTDDEELRDLSKMGTAYIVNGEDVNIDVNDGRWFPVYRAPVLPKQPQLVDLTQQVEILNRILNWILKELPVPTQKASAMAIRLSSVIDVISDLELSAPAPTKSEIPFGDVEPIEVTDDMVYAFHNQLSDSALTSDEFTDIKHGLCAALMNIPRPAQHVSEPKP